MLHDYVSNHESIYKWVIGDSRGVSDNYSIPSPPTL